MRSKKYAIRMFYVTTGRCSNTIIKEAKERARNAEGPAEIRVLTNKQVLILFENYEKDVIPSVPPLALRILSEGPILNEGVVRRYDHDKKIESWVFTMSGKELGEIYNKIGRRIFARNIRGYQGNTKINDSMADTIKKESKNFWYYNNGVTIVCDDAKREMQMGEDVLIVEGAQIINGQQTTITLSKGDSKGTHVLVKVVKIPRNVGEEEEFDRLVNSIVRATNWQNPIQPSDLVSNDSIQIFLEKELRKRGYQYIRKRMSKSEAKRIYGDRTFTQINKAEMAQAVGGCLLDPVIVRKGKEGLFEDPHYKSIFGSRSPSFYLPKYWLMRETRYAAKGKPSRAYPMWLVLNFAWDLISKHVDSKSSEKRFRYACEHDDNRVLNPLNRTLVDVFRSALKFYRLNKGKGEEARDISTFFQLSKLHEKFRTYWDSNKNSHRKRVKKSISKFAKALDKIEPET